MNNKYFIFSILCPIMFFSAFSFVLAEDDNSSSQRNYPALSCVSGSNDCVLKIGVGGQFSIPLEGNATTGYSWMLDYDKSYLQLDYTGVESLCSSSSSGSVLVGCGETTTYNYSALKLGTTKITATYSRPWESVQPAKKVVYNITIAAARVDGECGLANGVAASSLLPSDLCKAGIASTVTGAGSWSWTCKGSNGGITVSCNAPLNSSNSGQVCTQVITSAKNPSTSECREFGTPCSVPSGWVQVDSCSGSSSTANEEGKGSSGSSSGNYQQVGPISIDKPLNEMSRDELLKVLISLLQALLAKK